MMKKKIVWIFALLFAVMGTACGVSDEKTSLLENEENPYYTTLSSEEIARLREKIGNKSSSITRKNYTESSTTYALSEENVESAENAENVDSLQRFAVGIWIARTTEGTERYFVFKDNQTGHCLEQETGARMDFTYQMQSPETAVFHFGEENTATAFVSWSSISNAYVSWQDGQMEKFTLSNDNPEAELKFYSNQQLCEMAVNFYQAKTGLPADRAFAMVDADENILIQVYDDSNGYSSTLDSYIVDRYTATGKDVLNQPVDLTTAPQIPKSSDGTGASGTTSKSKTTTSKTTTATTKKAVETAPVSSASPQATPNEPVQQVQPEQTPVEPVPAEQQENPPEQSAPAEEQPPAEENFPVESHAEESPLAESPILENSPERIQVEEIPRQENSIHEIFVYNPYQLEISHEEVSEE